MQGQKLIIIVDNNEARRNQLETVFSFVGEHFTSCRLDELTYVFKPDDNILTVVFAGELDQQALGFIKNNPAMPFLLHDVVDTHQVEHAVNVLGQLNVPLNYAQLTELIHHCHQYQNKLPSKRRGSPGNNP